MRNTEIDEREAVFIISVAARLVEMHPSTLRKYERCGLLEPCRMSGRLRLYSPEEIDRLLELTDPQLVGLCFDTGHYRFGGGDPVAGLRRHRDRIWHMHFKDCSPALHKRSREEDGVTDKQFPCRVVLYVDSNVNRGPLAHVIESREDRPCGMSAGWRRL